MLEQYYVRPDTVDRVRSSWIGEGIEKYVAWLTERRYACRSVYRRIPVLVRFGHFAEERGAREFGQLGDHVEPFVQKWIREHAGGKTSAQQRKKTGQTVRNPIQQMLRLIVPDFTGLGRPHKPENPFQGEAPRFVTVHGFPDSGKEKPED